MFLFRTSGDVTAVDVVNRAVGGSFIACGLITWQHRPDNRTGVLLTVTGFLFLAEPLLIEVDSSVAYTLGQVVANWWTIPFAILILAFPSGRITSRVDAWIIALFVAIEALWQIVYIAFLPFPAGKTNVILISANAHAADVIDTYERWAIVVVGGALVVVGVSRWLRAPPLLRRLLLPTLAGSIAALVLILWVAYRLLVDEPARATRSVTSIVLLLVPLAFVLGLMRAQFARAGMADLIVALQRAPEPGRLGEVIARALRDPTLVLAYWLPRFDRYADADGHAVTLPEPGSGRTTTFVENEGRRVAALIHDSALEHHPELLEVVCAAANVALERERLQAELEARVVELHASRERIVAAGDAERRRLERNLHDGAQQRLVAIALQLRLIKGRIQRDPDVAEELVTTASDELALGLAELRELARGLHPAVLEHGLAAALDGLASRSVVETTVTYEPDGRLPGPVELAAYFVASEALANIAKYAQATTVTMRVRRAGELATIEIADDGVGGADDAAGSGLRGLADRVEALHGSLSVSSPLGAGTVVTAELPCGS